MTAEECEFVLGEMHFAAKRWGNPDGIPTLALHGWLDNAASFDFVGPLLPQLDLVCPDLAGHGKTDHRSHFGSYNIWQDVGEIFAMADALGWERFNLIGHSRGAVITLLAAGTFPERIQRLALIEGICPFLSDEAQAPQQLAEAIVSLKQQAAKAQAIHPSLDRAIEARAQGMFPVSRIDAEALAARSVEPFEGGFTWAHDYKLMASSELRLTPAQWHAFVAAISVPIHLLSSRDGLLVKNAPIQSWLDEHPQVQQSLRDGGHHLHMSSHCTQVAAWLAGIFSQTP